MTTEAQILQPIHPTLLPRLLPEYAAFHIANIQHKPYLHELPWDPAVRLTQTIPGASEPLKVGSIQDYALSKFSVRVYTPEDSAPEGGWPVFIFFHGGGWTLGNISTGAAICTNLCKRAQCVVVAVDYRLAPENPYPAAVDDSVEALYWVYEQGATLIGINPAKIAVGGGSSGGNLAAVLTHKAALASPPIPLIYQVLFVPVTDNTADPEGVKYPSWSECANTVALVPGRMLWFRDYYLPNEADRAKWDNSPIYAPDEAFKRAPSAYIVVAELDILRDEAIAYGEKLKQAGVEVELKVYKGCPHPISSMDGAVLDVGKQVITDVVKALAKAFGTQYSD